MHLADPAELPRFGITKKIRRSSLNAFLKNE